MHILRVALSVFFLGSLLACGKTMPPEFNESLSLPLAAEPMSYGPRLSAGPDQSIILSWMQNDEETSALKYSNLGVDGWQEPKVAVSDPGMFVNWADLPSVTRLSDNHLIAQWLSYSADLTYAYDVLLAQSLDGGQTWSSPLRPHKDGTETEHGFVSLLPVDDGTALIWLDGRKTINEVTDDPVASGMTLRAAVVDKDSALHDEQQIDELVCDCCQTDVAISTSGPIAVYRDRSVDEIRDIFISRLIDRRWQTGQPLSEDGWEISGCPVNGPAIDARDEFVAVAWFTAANDEPLVRLRISTDGGAEFGEPIAIASGSVLGHVDVAIINESSVAVSWLEPDTGELNGIRVRSIAGDSTLGNAYTVGRTRMSSVVPQMLVKDHDLVFAWTDEVQGEYRLASVRVPIVLAD